MDARRVTRVLILGGGFAGVATAQALSRRFRGQAAVEITLVSRDTNFVFSPLLIPASVGSIDMLHSVAPLRGMLTGIHCRIEEVVSIDLRRRAVHTASPTSGGEYDLPFDHLVIALGASINLSNLPGVAQHGRAMTTLGDAVAIRNHVLRLLEAAELEIDPAVRREMLTFVVAGGGLSAVGMAAELNDLLRDVITDYPSITRDQVKTILVHADQRILPECSPTLASSAMTQIQKRGVEVRLGAPLAGALPNEAILNSGQRIPTRTLIVMTDNAPAPILDGLQVQKQRGRIVVDEFMRVPGHAGVWALGDNAVVPNQASPSGESSPHTAEHALQQGSLLAQNIAATLASKPLKPFASRGKGPRCLVGRRSALAELPFGIQLAGFPGWWLWRRVYWAKLPGKGRKLQVGLDWLVGWFAAREVAPVSTARTQVLGHAHYEAGEYVIRQGDQADRVYRVTSGEVEVVRELPSGEEEILARLAEGEFFGENALLARRRRNASVRCVTPVDVLTIERDEFAGLTEVRQLPTAAMRAAAERRSASSDEPGQVPVELATARAGYLLRRDSGSEINLDAVLLSLGSSADNNVVVDDPRASRRHALIQRDGESYWLDDLGGPHGTLLNGTRIAQRTRLKTDDRIRIGGTEFTFREPEFYVLPQRATTPQMARLVRSSTGEALVINLDTISLGRGPQNHVVVADPAVSRRHALIEREGDTYWAEDLGSPNGVLVNKRRLTERTQLKHGDVLRLGSTEFSFELVAPEAARPARPAADPSATQVAVRLLAPAIRMQLEVCAGASVGQTFELDEQGGTIGRATTHSVSLLDSSLSRDHARIDFRDGGYWLSDLHSRNGTSVNHEPLGAAHLLRSGDVIELGQTRLMVTLREDVPD
jgi:NADH:quinone reductase (non-electrogenic)